MSLEQLLNKTEKELNKMRKDEIISEIRKHAWLFNHTKAQSDKLSADIKLMKAPYDQAKQILIGATGVEVEKDDYTGMANLEKVDLCYLVGVLLSRNNKQ